MPIIIGHILLQVLLIGEAILVCYQMYEILGELWLFCGASHPMQHRQHFLGTVFILHMETHNKFKIVGNPPATPATLATFSRNSMHFA